MYVNKNLFCYTGPVSMSLHGEQSSLDEFRTVLNWQNGYSKFYTNTNKLCMDTPSHSLNSQSHSSSNSALHHSNTTKDHGLWLKPLAKLQHSILRVDSLKSCQQETCFFISLQNSKKVCKVSLENVCKRQRPKTGESDPVQQNEKRYGNNTVFPRKKILL